MNRARLMSLPHCGVAYDSETHLIQRGLPAPPIVCGSWGWFDAEVFDTLMVIRDAELSGRGSDPRVIDLRAEIDGRKPICGAFLTKEQAITSFVQLIEDPRRVLVGANIQFDLLVLAVELAKRGVDIMPAIFQAFEDGRIYDLQIAEALHAIAGGYLGKDPRTGMPLISPETGRRGRYSLSICVDLTLGRTDAKANDEWKLRYFELEGVPYEEWPEAAVEYPIDDARNTIECALAQTGHIPKTSPHHNWGREGCLDCGARSLSTTCLARRPHANLHDLANQVYASWAMYLGAAWGFHVNQASVDLIENDARESNAAAIAPFIEAGFIRPDGTGNQAVLKRRIAQAYGSAMPCVTCSGTGKVPSPTNPRSKINCFILGEDGETRLKTCDGTGFVLAANVPRAEKEGVSTSGDVLSESGDELLMNMGHYKEDQKILDVYVPYLRQARVENPATGEWRDVPLILRSNAIVESGRASYGGSIHQFPRWPSYTNARGERIPSLRECIEARPGMVLSSQDYEGGELVTHGQSTLWITGSSELARALVNKIKPHNALGATIIGMNYKEFSDRYDAGDKLCKNARQVAKILNFGLGGAMGPLKIVLTQRKQRDVNTPHPNGPNIIKDEDGNDVHGWRGIRFCVLVDGAQMCGTHMTHEWNDQRIPPTCTHCLEVAVRMRDTWLRQWPENVAYRRFVKECIDKGMVITGEALARWPHLQDFFTAGQRLDPGQIMQHVSGRLRGGLEYSACANTFFQALLADVSKAALRRVSRECYDRTAIVPDMAHHNSTRSRFAGGPSPLFGSRVILFAHDEIMLEHPEAVASEASTRCAEIMVEEFRWFCPDLAPACKVEPTLMRRWSKSAVKKLDSNGRVIPWD